MKFKREKKFDQDIDTIYASYIDKDFIVKKLEAKGDRNIKVKVKKDGAKVKVTISREVKTEAKGVVKKFVKPWNKTTQTETWKGSEGGPYKGKIEIEAEGLPVTITGKIKLSKDDEGCTAVVVTDVESSVPLIGGKIAEIVSKESGKGIKQDMEYVAENA